MDSNHPQTTPEPGHDEDLHDVLPSTKVKEVRQHQSKAGVYADVLIYKGRELQDAMTLDYYNIEEGSVIEAEEF
ncbi:unnamed protein product [Rhizoctonia solani]|uniref:Ubiquitin-like domain-containing protein n=1 Tax=Rhizoctonia solani TaxID=456999 RepID=A0A8H2WXM5_9AGAM|nr:unnamed protein product [Rhizoctonia solani]